MLLKATHIDAKLLAPAESEYCKAKVWVKADPELGVAETAVTLDWAWREVANTRAHTARNAQAVFLFFIKLSSLLGRMGMARLQRFGTTSIRSHAGYTKADRIRFLTLGTLESA